MAEREISVVLVPNTAEREYIVMLSNALGFEGIRVVATRFSSWRGPTIVVGDRSQPSQQAIFRRGMIRDSELVIWVGHRSSRRKAETVHLRFVDIGAGTARETAGRIDDILREGQPRLY